MNRYAKLYGSIWTDEKFSSLSSDSKLLYLYLISCKSCNSVGLFKLGKGTITDEFCSDLDGNERITSEDLDKCIEELNNSGLATYKNRWVMFNNWMRWNLPSSPVHVPGLSKEIDDLVVQKPPIEFMARLLHSMTENLMGLVAKKETGKKTYYAILREHLNSKALSEFFRGEDNVSKAFSGTFKTEEEKTQMMSPRDYLKIRYSLGNQKVMNKEEGEGEEEGKEEGEEKGKFSSPYKKNTEAEISLLCSDGQIRVVSPSAVLQVLSSHPSLDIETLRAKVQSANLKNESKRPSEDSVDQFFLDVVKEVV